MSNEAVCRTAPATPGLLIIAKLSLYNVEDSHIGLIVNQLLSRLDGEAPSVRDYPHGYSNPLLSRPLYPPCTFIAVILQTIMQF